MKQLLSLLAAVLLAAEARGARTWTVEAIDTAGAGRYSSMKIDKDGNVHVAYVLNDNHRYPLKYAIWDSKVKRWFTMPVAEGSGACSLTLDSRQRPHISWTDAGSASGSKLHHAYWNGTAWKTQTIPLNSDIIAYYNSIVVDQNDRPSISFYEYRGPKDTNVKIRLRNVMFNGEYWEVRTIDSDEGSGKFNSSAADSKGGIHVAYANVSAVTDGLRYAFWNGKTWKPEIIEPGPFGFSVFIALDKDGSPHISYMNEATGVVKYAYRDKGRWNIESVDALAGVGYPDRNSVAFDEAGQVYMSYYDGGRGVLKLARRVAAGKWEVQAIDGNGAGFSSSAQIDRGTIWVSYADDANNVFKVAHAQLEPLQTSAAGNGKAVRPD